MTNMIFEDFINDFVDQIITENNPMILDDDLPDLIADGDNRENAINELISRLEKMKE